MIRYAKDNKIYFSEMNFMQAYIDFYNKEQVLWSIISTNSFVIFNTNTDITHDNIAKFTDRMS